MFACLLATVRKNLRTDLHEIFREGWQRTNELNFGGDLDTYRDTGKTCLGRGMHCPSAFSLLYTLLGLVTHRI